MVKLNLGIRAHDIAFHHPEEIAKEVSSKGLSSVQLALGKSFKDFQTGNGCLSPGLANYIGDTFHNNGVQIAILGCYINMIHPDMDERRKVLDRFKEHIRFARDFGCSIVGSETGNVHAKMGYTEDNFHEHAFESVVESVRELVIEAEKFGVIVGIEGGINHPVYSPRMMSRLLDNIDSTNLQVIYDPANFMTVDNYTKQEAVIQEAIDLFGDRIIAVHAKDFILEDNKIKMVPVGTGLLNYEFLFRWMKYNKPFINVLLENTKEPHINNSIDYLKQQYNKV